MPEQIGATVPGGGGVVPNMRAEALSPDLGGPVKYVDLNATAGDLAGVIDPNPYLERLPEIAEALPAGARAFATDPDHYDFMGKRCVKDLELARVEGPSGGDLVLCFRHNCWKHEEDLIIRYRGVTAFTVEAAEGEEPADLGPLILDEVLPHEGGCTHEFAFIAGTLCIACCDLEATWVYADCPDRRPS